MIPQANLYFEATLLDRAVALRRFSDVRAATLRLTAPLSAEDAGIQTMPDVSPAKWHLAHTTWVFEAFVLKPLNAGYTEIDPHYHYLFNSYYEAEGPRHPRPQRGLISRPSLEQVLDYRAHVDAAMASLIEGDVDDEAWAHIAPLVDLACQHEEQHQELILTDIKHVLWSNPLKPSYTQTIPKEVRQAAELSWTDFDEGLREIGHDGSLSGSGFAYDNEGPRHKQYVHGFQLASRPSTNGEYLKFIEDGGYARPEFWLSDGWATVQAEGWTKPLYWEQKNSDWQVFTLRGQHGMNEAEPVAHLSYFEADAFARWSGARLPREAELEIALARHGDASITNDAASGALNPVATSEKSVAGLDQLYGDVWEWTQSSYSAYPGYKPAPGAIGEYNGKFMCNQYVLKGGSCFTPPGHIRATYRNFFPADARWQMTGVRLAKDI